MPGRRKWEGSKYDEITVHELSYMLSFTFRFNMAGNPDEPGEQGVEIYRHAQKT